MTWVIWILGGLVVAGLAWVYREQVGDFLYDRTWKFWTSAGVAVVVLIAGWFFFVRTPPPSEGKLTYKYIDPESTYVIMQCLSYGKYGCTGYYPQTIHDDTDYVFTYQNCEDGPCRTGQSEVKPETYENFNIGDWFVARSA